MNEKRNSPALFLYFGISAFLTAAVLRFAIEYLQTGKAGFSINDRIFVTLAIGVFVVLIFGRYLASYILRCSVCGKLSQDVMIFKGGRSGRFCREHLIERFRNEFTACSDRMVVIYPSLEMKTGPYVYEYRAIGDIPEKFLQSRFGRTMMKALLSIEGKCARCSRDATVAYFGPGNTLWEFVGMRGKQWDDVPNMEMPAIFRLTCPFCIADELCFSLSRFDGVFSEGIILPHNGSGIFVPRLG